MSDDVRQAAFIGAAINKGVGGIPTFRRKKNTKDKKEKVEKPTTAPKEETAEPKKTTEKPTEKLSAPKKTTEKPSGNKPKVEKPSEPVFVKSERIRPEVTSSSPAAISYSPRNLPTHGPGSEFNPNRGRQFNG